MEQRWQVRRWDGEHEGDWVDAEPPDAKVLDLAGQIIALEQQVQYWQDERSKFINEVWEATGASGDYDYPGQVIREVAELRTLVQGVVDCVKHERTNKHGTFVELHISDTDYVFKITGEEDRRGSPIFAAVRAIYRYVKGIE